MMADIRRIALDEVVRHFEELGDPRSTVNLQHPLVSVVVIALMAVLAGASGPTATAGWAASKEEFLIGALDLPDGVPRKDDFRRVLMALRPWAFQACFVSWLESLRAAAAEATGMEQPVLAVDGKAARRSHDRKNGLGAFHSASVWASELGLTLGYQVQAAGAVAPALEASIVHFAPAVEEHNPGQSVHGRALVESGLDAAAQLDFLQSVKCD